MAYEDEFKVVFRKQCLTFENANCLTIDRYDKQDYFLKVFVYTGRQLSEIVKEKEGKINMIQIIEK